MKIVSTVFDHLQIATVLGYIQPHARQKFTARPHKLEC